MIWKLVLHMTRMYINNIKWWLHQCLTFGEKSIFIGRFSDIFRYLFWIYHSLWILDAPVSPSTNLVLRVTVFKFMFLKWVLQSSRLLLVFASTVPSSCLVFIVIVSNLKGEKKFLPFDLIEIGDSRNCTLVLFQLSYLAIGSGCS